MKFSEKFGIAGVIFFSFLVVFAIYGYVSNIIKMIVLWEVKSRRFLLRDVLVFFCAAWLNFGLFLKEK